MNNNMIEFYYRKWSSVSYLLLIILFLISACSSTRRIDSNVQRGSNYLFKAGFPEVRISAIGLFDDEGNPGINVSADIVYGSLIFKERNDSLTADIDIEVRILKMDDSSNTVILDNFDVRISEKNKNITNSQEVYSFEKRFPVTPGKYDVIVTVTDQNSKKEIVRAISTLIPETDDNEIVLTNIQLLGIDNEAEENHYKPITTYDVSKDIDSLKFIFQVSNGIPNNPVEIFSQIIQYKSDTSHARGMGERDYSPSNIAYKGVDYSQNTIIQSNRRILNQTGNVLIEFIFPSFKRGNYRFRTNITNNNEEIFKARDFGIKSKSYPALKTPGELARPLAYLMNKEEYDRLMNIKDSDSLKTAIDRFWLKHLKNKSKAKQIIELYYSRVEEANKLFSNFKEGWKTDPGMIYILFGRPLYFDEYINRMTWFYSYNRDDPRNRFKFTKPTIKNPGFPFDHFLLERTFFYHNIEYDQVQLWLTGKILSVGS